MADISKITTLDGTTYDIKDATARTFIENVPTDYYNKTEIDTMLGDVETLLASI